MVRRSARTTGGFTLVELNVAMLATAVIMVGLGGIFVSIHRTTERVTYQGTAQMAQSDALLRISEMVRQAARIELFSRFTPNDTILVTYPDRKTPEGEYSPRLVGSALKYVAGSQRSAYYLSDSTGSVNASGNILWLASISTVGTVTPVASVSLHPGTSRGQVAPVKSIRIDPPSFGDPQWLYTVTVTVLDQRNRAFGERSVSSQVYAANHE